jgi:hypothetical protein
VILRFLKHRGAVTVKLLLAGNDRDMIATRQRGEMVVPIVDAANAVVHLKLIWQLDQNTR